MKAILRFNLVLFEFLVTLLTLSIHYMKSTQDLISSRLLLLRLYIGLVTLGTET